MNQEEGCINAKKVGKHFKDNVEEQNSNADKCFKFSWYRFNRHGEEKRLHSAENDHLA